MGKNLFESSLGNSGFICLFNLLMKILGELIGGPNNYNLSDLFCFPYHHKILDLSYAKTLSLRGTLLPNQLISAQVEAQQDCFST